MAFFQFSRGYQITANASGGSLEFTVSTDKELVIEFVSGDGNIPSGQVFFVVFRLISPPPAAGGTSVTTGVYFIPVERAGSVSPSSDIFVFAQSMRVHVDPGTKVLITFPAGTGQGNFTMTGQILDAGSSGTSVNL
jgi:hypothetical protein